ncbi:hypothetical protein L3Y34_002558 [Caenorhabditis briggsae]|uniref:Uncharacterized protein n=1 Tax=Caenorhabditis briggsae TaxID=6238 RepID=A0AAE9IRU5_CAEBR|nr:hypothetical protein L3Y34_002558 [Caenorhabditis briggsae]
MRKLATVRLVDKLEMKWLKVEINSRENKKEDVKPEDVKTKKDRIFGYGLTWTDRVHLVYHLAWDRSQEQRLIKDGLWAALTSTISEEDVRREYGGLLWAAGYSIPNYFQHAAYLATQPTPTLFVGGFNPFEQKDVGAAIRKVRQLVAERFGQFCDVSSQNTPDVKFHKKLNTSMKLVFRPEDDDEDVRILENSEGSSGGHGVGHHQNSTIVID